MKNLWIAGLAVALVALGALAQTDTQPKIRDGVFIHISHGSDDPHRVLMALKMAEVMSEGHDVLVYFDIKGIEVVLKDAPDFQLKEFPSSKAQLLKLTAQKVTLMACPSCLKALGKLPADLAQEVQIADKEHFFSFTKGRILTLDY